MVIGIIYDISTIVVDDLYIGTPWPVDVQFGSAHTSDSDTVDDIWVFLEHIYIW